MEIKFLIEIFVIFFLIFILFWGCWRQILLNTALRCISGLVLLSLCNDAILYFGGNFVVKINEITAAVSALFGLSGIAGLYALQLFFTVSW